MDNHPGTVAKRWNPQSSRTPHQKWGTVTVAANTPLDIDTGLKHVDAAFAQLLGATPGATAVVIDSNGKISVESGTAGDVCWFAVGY